MDGSISEQPRVPRCHIPWQQMVIDSTGHVAPCCYWGAIDNRNDPVGNINTSSLEEIWNGPGYQRLRAGMASGDLEAAGCANCQAIKQGMELGFEYDPACEKETSERTRYASNIEVLKREIAAGATVLESKPTIVSFTPSHRCNIRCTHCYQEATRTAEIERKRAEDEVAALSPYLVRLVAGGGEPFVLPIWIRYLKEYDLSENPYLDFSTSTNATVLSDTVVAGLQRFAQLTINVSLDGTGEVYERVRVGADFAVVRDNIRRLKEIVANARSPRSSVGVSMCVMKSNVLDLPNFVRFCADEALSCGISPVTTYPPEESLRSFNDPPREMKGWAAAIDEAERLVRTLYLPRMAKLRNAPLSHPHEHEFWRNNFRLLRESIPLEAAQTRHYRTTVTLVPGVLDQLPEPVRSEPVKYAYILRAGAENATPSYWALIKDNQFDVSLPEGEYLVNIANKAGSPCLEGVRRICAAPEVVVELPDPLFRRFPDVGPGGNGREAYVFRFGDATAPISNGFAQDARLSVRLTPGDYCVNFPGPDGKAPLYWDVVRFRIDPGSGATRARYVPITMRRVADRVKRLRFAFGSAEKAEPRHGH